MGYVKFVPRIEVLLNQLWNFLANNISPKKSLLYRGWSSCHLCAEMIFRYVYNGYQLTINSELARTWGIRLSN
jgi:hypothetical protein